MKKEIFTPGRTELAGNHTDHQKGRILASAVDLGLYAKYEANDEGVVRIHSLGYEPFEVKISQLAVRPAFRNKGITILIFRLIESSTYRI